MMNLLKFFKRRNEIVLSPEARAKAAQGKVNEAFIMFKQADDTLDEVLRELSEASVEYDKNIASLENKLIVEKQQKQSILDNIEVNKKLRQNLSPFVQ
jgi:hypothetical protein